MLKPILTVCISLIILIFMTQCGGGDEQTTSGGPADSPDSPNSSSNPLVTGDGSSDEGSQATARQAFGHTDCVYGLQFSPDGNKLVSGGRDGALKMWIVLTGNLVYQKFIGSTVFDVAYAANGNWVAAGCEDGKVRVYNADSGEEVAVLSGHTDKVFTVEFSPTNELLASGGDDDTIILWKTSDWSKKSALTGHSDRITDLSFNNDGTKMVSATRFDHLRLWDVNSGREIQKNFDYDDIVALCVAFHPSGNKVVTGGLDEVLRLWDLDTGDQIRLFEGHSHEISGVCYSPRGLLISADKFGRILAWTEDREELLTHYSGNDQPIFALDISSELIAAGLGNGRIILWRAREATIFTPTGSY